MFTIDRFRLDGRTALVTGAGSGIGQGIALGLAQAGASVACFDRGRAAAEVTAQQIQSLGGQSLALAGDVTSPGDLAAAVESVLAAWGALDIGINCAGIANAAPAEEMPLDQWQRMLDVDLTGVFLSCQAEARAMLPAGRGAIVNIASMSGVIVNRGLLQAHYNSAKAGVIHLTKSLAMEWAARGLRVNAISPGYTLTPMNRRPEVAEQLVGFAADTPAGRIAEVEEMVGPAVFLASDAAAFVTGANLLVDGGFTCW
jgi:NAD(P)-dependent dehydrogenase (short-subunit alcohol dehydrogenase family)